MHDASGHDDNARRRERKAPAVGFGCAPAGLNVEDVVQTVVRNEGE